MTFRERMQPGSWRGIPFIALESGVGGGRRLAEHAFIDKEDDPWQEDLGRRATGIALSVAITGETFDYASDRLQRALEEKGEGALVWKFASFQAVVDTWLRREPAEETRVAYFDIVFRKVGPAPRRRLVEDPDKSAAQTALDIQETSAEIAPEELKTEGFPAFVADAAQAATDLVAGGFLVMDFANAQADKADKVAGQARRLAENAGDLVRAPVDLTLRIFRMVDDTLDSFGNQYRSAVAAYDRLFDLNFELSGASGLSGQQAERGALHVLNTARLGAAYGSTLAAIRAARTGQYASLEDAQAARDQIAGDLDSLQNTVPSSLFLQVQNLRSQISLGVPRADQRLPRVGSYTPPGDVPSLIVSYLLYGNPDSAEQIGDRNNAQNPAFLPEGVPLEVLVTDG